jgi:hypothetical protein
VRPPVGGGHTLRLGSDYRRSEGDLAEDAFNATTGALTAHRFAGGVNTDLGLFLEDDWELGPVTLTGGVRADRYAIEDGYFRSTNAAGRRPRTTSSRAFGLDLFVARGRGRRGRRRRAAARAAYTGLRLPTLNELYRPFAVFPVTTNANAALRNEHLEGYEAGIDWRVADKVSFSLTAFDNEVENAITNVTIGTNLRRGRTSMRSTPRGSSWRRRWHSASSASTARWPGPTPR